MPNRVWISPKLVRLRVAQNTSGKPTELRGELYATDNVTESVIIHDAISAGIHGGMATVHASGSGTFGPS